MRWTGSCGRSAAAVAVALLFAAGAGAERQKSARARYEEAQSAEQRLHRSASRLAKKAEWVRVARLYRSVVVHHPQSGYCDDALYYEAEIHREIDRRFGDRASIERALDAYLLLAEGYPSSKWVARARLNRGKVFLARSDRKHAGLELRKVTADWSSSAEAIEARRLLEDMEPRRAAAAPERFPAGIVGVRNIRHWTGREYTRIVIDIDDEVEYREGRLPDRIYFDLLGARLTQDLAARSFAVEDGFLQQIRVGQNRSDVVRVVLDFQNVSEYNVFTLPDPYRLVVDILGKAPQPAAETMVAEERAEAADPPAAEPVAAASPLDASDQAAVPAAAAVAPDVLRVPPQPREGGYSLVQQLGLGAYRVVIDPGHGGHDPGTMNKSGLREKDIVLDVSRRVSKLLQADGFEIMMTRERDVFVPLEERTAIANSKEADLFVSIHVNAARSTRPRGTETYYLNLATTPDAEEVAARENAVTTRRLGELQSLLQRVVDNSRITESRELAARVQRSMSEGLYASARDQRNRGVKTAPFYVLLGAQMPSILVEIAYLTNRTDAELLASPAFRQKVAESIATGIRTYQDSLVRTTKADASGDRIAGRP